MLQVHRRAQAVHLGADEVAGQHALQQPLIVAAGGLAGGGSAAVAGGNQLQRLRLGSAHAASRQAQALRALLHVGHGADQVALLAPQLQQAAAMLLAHRIAGRAHVEEHTAILQQRGRRVVGEVCFNCLGQPLGRRSLSVGGHLPLPALTRAQAGDVRGVVARVPFVHGQSLGQVNAATLGVVEALAEVVFGERFQQRHPAAMQPLNHRQGNIDGQPAVGQLCPGGLVIGLDRSANLR